MINHYFKQANNWYVIPEQIQKGVLKRPYYLIKKYSELVSYFKPHAFAEVKSLVNSNIDNILDLLFDSVLFTIYRQFFMFYYLNVTY